MEINNLPVYLLSLDENDDSLGCYKISLVEDPAVDKMFLKFNKGKKNNLKLSVQDESKHIVTGIAMRADYPIYRNDNGDEYYVMFSKDSIEQMMIKFMRERHLFDISLDHTTDINECYIVESYLINKERGICPKEFIDIEDGSWIITVKIDDPDVWNKIISGDVRGFSIETTMIANETFSKKIKSEEKLGITKAELSKLLDIFK